MASPTLLPANLPPYAMMLMLKWEPSSTSSNTQFLLSVCPSVRPRHKKSGWRYLGNEESYRLYLGNIKSWRQNYRIFTENF